MARVVLANNFYYHAFNRGVEKRNIFLDEKDYRRFLFSMKEFNDENSTINILRRLNANEGNPISLRPENKKPLIEIACYCLMPNHFHFILKQIRHNGISKFMQKVGIGYTNYFNQKYKRSGVLFQGKFKRILVEKENYLNYLTQYIHLNPLDIIEPSWKGSGLKNIKKARNFLEDYKWTDCKNYERYDEIIKEYSSDYFSSINNLILE